MLQSKHIVTQGDRERAASLKRRGTAADIRWRDDYVLSVLQGARDERGLVRATPAELRELLNLGQWQLYTALRNLRESGWIAIVSAPRGGRPTLFHVLKRRRSRTVAEMEEEVERLNERVTSLEGELQRA